jgi:hypothetical protein
VPTRMNGSGEETTATVVRISCPTCRAACDLRIREVHLLITATSARWSFTCPACLDRISDDASQLVVDLMLGAGVTATDLTDDLPAPLLLGHGIAASEPVVRVI